MVQPEQAYTGCVQTRHERDSRENEWDRAGRDGTERDWSIMVFGLKIPLITAHEWETRFINTVPKFRSFEQDGLVKTSISLMPDTNCFGVYWSTFIIQIVEVHCCNLQLLRN
jgi:hypothetical protein